MRFNKRSTVAKTKRQREPKICLNFACGHDPDNEPGNRYEQHPIPMEVISDIPKSLMKGLTIDHGGHYFECIVCGQVAVGTADDEADLPIALTKKLPLRRDPHTLKFTRILA